MKKNQRLSAIFVAVAATSLVLVSSASFAHKRHAESYKTVTSYKGENYKGEEPVAPCPPVLLLSDGFYVGIGAGYDAYRIRHSTYNVDPTGDIVSSNSLHRSATGWLGSVFAGYGRYFDTFYLGAEIFANDSNAEAKQDIYFGDGASFREKFNVRSSFGISIIPGLKVNDSSLLYVRVGYIDTSFKYRETLNAPGFGISEVRNSSNKRKNGAQYGVGIETAVAPNVSIRGEYNYVNYNSFTANYVTTSGYYAKFKPSDNQFVLSVLYHFA